MVNMYQNILNKKEIFRFVHYMRCKVSVFRQGICFQIFNYFSCFFTLTLISFKVYYIEVIVW